MGYSLGQVRGYLAAIATLERERVLLSAVATRMAGASDEAWQKWAADIITAA